MNLSDILVARNLVSVEDIQQAGEYQRETAVAWPTYWSHWA